MSVLVLVWSFTLFLLLFVFVVFVGVVVVIVVFSVVLVFVVDNVILGNASCNFSCNFVQSLRSVLRQSTLKMFAGVLPQSLSSFYISQQLRQPYYNPNMTNIPHNVL